MDFFLVLLFNLSGEMIGRWRMISPRPLVGDLWPRLGQCRDCDCQPLSAPEAGVTLGPGPDSGGQRGQELGPGSTDEPTTTTISISPFHLSIPLSRDQPQHGLSPRLINVRTIFSLKLMHLL